MPETSVQVSSWAELSKDDLYSIMRLRTDVFFLEQRAEEEELDFRDQEPATRHYWIADGRVPAAYLRVLLDAQPQHRDARRVIGRVAVRADRRGEGLAQVLMRRVLADFGAEAMMLHAQQYIVPLYAKFSFEVFGELYQEAGIPHLSMYRPGGAAE